MAVGDSRAYFDEITECAMNGLSFDEVAVVAVCHFADLKHCDKIRPSLRRVNMLCRDVGGVRGIDEMEENIDWAGLYNKMFGDIVDEYGIETEVDYWGSYCWIGNDEKHCGDASNLYPMYLKEETLRKHLEEAAED